MPGVNIANLQGGGGESAVAGLDGTFGQCPKRLIPGRFTSIHLDTNLMLRNTLILGGGRHCTQYAGRGDTSQRAHKKNTISV